MGAYFTALTCVHCTGTFYLQKNAKTFLAVIVTDILVT